MTITWGDVTASVSTDVVFFALVVLLLVVVVRS